MKHSSRNPFLTYAGLVIFFLLLVSFFIRDNIFGTNIMVTSSTTMLFSSMINKPVTREIKQTALNYM